MDEATIAEQFRNGYTSASLRLDPLNSGKRNLQWHEGPFMIEILPETRLLLEELKQFKFFLNVGECGNIKSWHNAISSLRSGDWYQLLERSRVAILSVPVEANDGSWTPKVRFFKKELIDLIAKIELPSEKKGDRDVFDYIREEILAQTLGLLMEVETSHGHSDAFMRDVWTITKKGYFVCGYSGDYPNGAFKFF